MDRVPNTKSKLFAFITRDAPHTVIAKQSPVKVFSTSITGYYGCFDVIIQLLQIQTLNYIKLRCVCLCVKQYIYIYICIAI